VIEIDKRWTAAIAGSIAIHVGLLVVAGAFWSWDSIRSRQPVYVEVTLAELFAPPGEAGGGGNPTAEPPTRQAPISPAATAEGFSENPAQKIAGGLPGGTGGTGGGSGGGHGPGKGTGIGPGTGTGTGVTRGPRIVDGAKPEYPETARSKGWEGTVRLQILVSVGGRVEEVRLVGSSGYSELDHAALRGVRSWRFSPALQNGTPVAAWATLPIVFDLR